MSDKLRILVINQYFPPDTSATAEVFRDVAWALEEAGHEVVVLCGRPSYQPTERRSRKLFSRRREGDVVVERVGSFAFDRSDMNGRVANYLSFAALASLRVLFRRQRPDVVLVGSDPPFSVWVALLAARGRPVVYSLRDLHPEFAIVSGMIRPGLITRLWDALHRAGLRRCSRVVCLGEDMAKRVRAKGVDPGRIAVIPDGAWPAHGATEPTVVVDLRGKAELVVAHAGNLGGAGAWETLAQAARSIDDEASFLFVGSGSKADLIREAGLRLVPFRPAEEIPSVMAAGDLQVVSLRRGMEGLVVPSKLYTILSHGRPVLAVVPEESDVCRIVKEWGCGLVCDPDEPSDVADKVRWARSHPNALAEMSRRALEAGAFFERGHQLQRFVGLFEEISVRPRRGTGDTELGPSAPTCDDSPSRWRTDA